MKRARWLLAAFVVIVLFTACDKEYNVTVDCKDISKFAGAMGLINAPNLSLFDLIAVNDKSKEAFYVKRVSSAQDDKVNTDTIAESSEGFSDNFGIELSGNYPETVSVEIKTIFTKAISLKVSNYFRESLRDIPSFVLNKAEIIKEMKNQPSNIHFLIISAVVNAKEVNIEYANSASAGANVSVMKYGEYKFNITSEINSKLHRVAENRASLFLKTTPLVLSKQEDADIVAIDYNSQIDLRDYNFAQHLK